jgi:hypothetical protein
MFHRHKYGKVEDGYQYCIKCGKAILAPVAKCQHVWKADGFISNCKEWDSLVTRASRKLEEDITEAKLEEGGPTIPSENLKRVFRKVINAFSQEISYENILPGVFLKDDGAVAFVMQKDKHRVEIEIRESIEGQLSEKFKAVLADAEKTLEAIRTGNLD